ncbi:MAG TPA: Ig-like domain-containing protein [Candidatus Dojkabacteria bacterium]|nr:Ig-like domain-containing protein [Candidatus Dojkabacteria bacterium]HQF36881.1 Ig-like domain-containing protein [Candidatus Dojkabacteria bacterium]
MFQPKNNKSNQPNENKPKDLITFIQKNLAKGFILFSFFLLTTTTCYILGTYLFTSRPYIVREISSANYNGKQIIYDVYFNIPVNTKSLEVIANTEIPLKVKQVNILPFVRISRHIQIISNQNISEDELLTPYLSGVSSIFGKTENEYSVEYQAMSVPSVTSCYPSWGEQDISPQSDLFIFFSQNIENNEWNVEITPYIEHEIEAKDNRIIIIPVSDLQRDTDYQIKLFRTPLQINSLTNEIVTKGETAEVFSNNFSTIKTPELQEYQPSSGYLYDGTNIEITFNTPILPESFIENINITPNQEGEWIVLSNTKFAFVPQTLYQKDTKYLIQISRGIKTSDGDSIPTEINLEFTTPGEIKVVKTSPVSGANKVSVNTKSFSIEFDQNVDHQSVETNLTISPHISGNFSWDNDKLIYTFSQSLAYGQTYQISIKSPIKAISGIDSDKNIIVKFTTEEEVTLLNVPWLRQSESHTCNITAGAMVLRYRGVDTSENAVRERAGEQPQLQEHLGIGGDPYKGWVNYYGLNWTRLSEIISSYGINNEIKYEWNVVALAKEIENGNPSILYWQNGASDPYWKTWTTPEEKQIWGLNGMHSEVVVGFTGPSDNPTGFYTNDPWRGKNRYYNISTFKNLWGRLKNETAGIPGNIAIVIY